MIQFPSICKACSKFLDELAVGGGGLAFCDHAGGGHTAGTGVYISLVAAPDPQMQIIYPLSKQAAIEMATVILAEANNEELNYE